MFWIFSRNKISNLIKRRSNVLAVFNKAKEELTKLNTDILNQQAAVNAKIIAQQKQLTELEELKASNDKQILNFSKILD